MSVSDNKNAKRFELQVEDQTVFANYKIENSVLFINYVESPVALRGKGAASNLMTGIAEIAKVEKYKIVPICSYAAAWFKRNEKYQSLLE